MRSAAAKKEVGQGQVASAPDVAGPSRGAADKVGRVDLDLVAVYETARSAVVMQEKPADGQHVRILGSHLLESSLGQRELLRVLDRAEAD